MSEGWIDYRKNGRKYINWVFAPKRADDGSVEGFLVFMRDLTELKQREEDLASRSAQLETTLANIGDGVNIVDREGRRTARWREELLCPITRLNNRQRGMAAFARDLLLDREQGVHDVYLTEQVTPLFRWITDRFRTVRITGSEYLGPGLPAGAVREGIVHRDVEALGLPSSSLDLVLSCDVLEHVNEPQAALAEIFRVLRPGGRLLFTVPFMFHYEKNVRRARLAGGAVEHLREPSYHGNPIDEKGSLAYFDFGWELLDWVRESGFREVAVFCFWSEALGHLGGALDVFHARR